MRERRNRARTSFGGGVGGDIEILGFAAEQEIPYRAADDEGGIAGFHQGAGGLQGAGWIWLRRMPCLGQGIDDRAWGRSGLAEDFVEPAADHCFALARIEGLIGGTFS
jgi:hypothetical protein